MSSNCNSTGNYLPRSAPQPASISSQFAVCLKPVLRCAVSVVVAAVCAFPAAAQIGTGATSSSGQGSTTSGRGQDQTTDPGVNANPGAGSGAGAQAPQPAATVQAAPVTIRSGDDNNPGQTGAAANNPGQLTGTGLPGSSPANGSRASTAPTVPPVRLSDFEIFVRDTIGYPLPVFGRDLFSNSAGFQAASSVAPADYLIGPGDELRIRGVGNVNIDVRATVDAGGRIFIPQVGPVTVAGTRVDQVTDVVRRAIARQFKGFDLTVTLGQLRSMQIFILGQARNPGTYTVSSLSTLVNALFASGGPSASGSLRDIQLIRAGETIAHFDVYRLLLSGDKTADRHLLAGDILYIPPVGPQVAIAGDVDTPAIFELNGPTSVADALTYAAGLTPIAGVSRATLDRVSNHERRSVLNFPLDPTGRTTVLQGGDILRILPISAKIDDAVTLRGPVGNPGRYAWHQGMRVSDLIPTRESLLTRDFYNQRNALDLPTDTATTDTSQNKSATGGDARFSPAAGTTDARFSPAAGTTDARFSPAAGTTADARTTDARTTDARTTDARTTDARTAAPAPAVSQHDTDFNWNYATIERIDPQDLKVQLIPFSLGQAIDQPSSAENKVLLAGDVIVVYSSRDLALPLELTTRFVRIDGQVVAPGVYQMHGNENLRDLIRRAGGLAPHAYLYASQLTRESVRLEQDLKLQQLLQRESSSAFSPTNIVTPKTGTDSSAAELTLRRAYLAELARLHSTGRVVLGLQPQSRSAEDVPDLALEDADHFFVPTLPNIVNVLGSVYSPGALRYVDHGRVKRYLNAAGGPEREADQSRAFILRADGTLISKNRISNFDRQVLYPGDSVVIPASFKNRKPPIDFLDLSTALSSLALGAVAIKAVN